METVLPLKIRGTPSPLTDLVERPVGVNWLGVFERKQENGLMRGRTKVKVKRRIKTGKW
jgi:hypothetical protein